MKISLNTMESKIQSHLFFAGEVLIMQPSIFISVREILRSAILGLYIKLSAELCAGTKC